MDFSADRFKRMLCFPEQKNKKMLEIFIALRKVLLHEIMFRRLENCMFPNKIIYIITKTLRGTGNFKLKIC